MIKVRALLVVFVMVTSLTACLPSVGGSSFSQDELSKNLIAGITTQDEVRKMYGEPTEISKSSKGDVWKYIEKPSAVSNMFSRVVQDTGAAALGQATAHVGLAAADKGGVIGGVAAGSAVNSVGNNATDAINDKVQNAEKTLIIYFDKRKILKEFLIY